MDNESKHFPLKRTLNFILTFLLLLTTSVLFGNKYQEQSIDKVYGYSALGLFMLYTLASTWFYARNLKLIH